MSPRRRKGPSPSSNGHAPAPPKQVRQPLIVRLLARPDADSPFPPYGRAVLRGLGAVAVSWQTLVTSFVMLLALWLGLVALGFQGPLGRLANLLALPPISTYADALNSSATFGYGTASFVATTGFIVVRSLVTALLAGLAVGSLQGWTWRLSILRGLRAVPASAIAALLGLGVLILGSVIFPLLGPGLGFLGSILALVASLMLFIHAPIVAVVEPLSAVESVRKGMRAALMPGSRHLLLSIGYFFLALPILPALTPEGPQLGVNPSLAAWAYAFLASWIHVGFLAAFAYRYIAVKDVVPEAVPRAPRQPRAKREPRGRKGD